MFLPVISNPRDCFCSLPISPPSLLIFSNVSFASGEFHALQVRHPWSFQVRTLSQWQWEMMCKTIFIRKTAALVVCSNTENNSCASFPDSRALAVLTVITVCTEKLICTTSSRRGDSAVPTLWHSSRHACVQDNLLRMSKLVWGAVVICCFVSCHSQTATRPKARPKGVLACRTKKNQIHFFFVYEGILLLNLPLALLFSRSKW